jgi:hypothetical protein
VASAQATETSKFDPAESDDFDSASDLCDFGFVLSPKPAPKTLPENLPPAE